jgi:hypothetical protein
MNHDYRDLDLDYLIQSSESFESAKDFVLGLQECLTQEWDADKARHCLEELCHYMSVPYQDQPFTIEAKPCE